MTDLSVTIGTGPDEPLLVFIGACLKRFGPGIRLRYETTAGECVLAFPAQPTAQPETVDAKTALQTSGGLPPSATREGAPKASPVIVAPQAQFDLNLREVSQ